jgi:hypothetical protein
MLRPAGKFQKLQIRKSQNVAARRNQEGNVAARRNQEGNVAARKIFPISPKCPF